MCFNPLEQTRRRLINSLYLSIKQCPVSLACGRQPASPVGATGMITAADRWLTGRPTLTTALYKHTDLGPFISDTSRSLQTDGSTAHKLAVSWWWGGGGGGGGSCGGYVFHDNGVSLPVMLKCDTHGGYMGLHSTQYPYPQHTHTTHTHIHNTHTQHTHTHSNTEL